jgi:hypothetical protein
MSVHLVVRGAFFGKQNMVWALIAIHLSKEA